MKRHDILQLAFFEAFRGDYRTLMGLIDTLRERYTSHQLARRATKYNIPYHAAIEAIEYLSVH